MNAIKKIFLLAVGLIFWLSGCADAEVVSTSEEAGDTSLGATAPLESPQIQDENIWLPEIGSTWQWQLSDLSVDMSVEADVYNIDLSETDATLVEELHAMGRKVVCYISVGSWEDWREDAELFPDEVIGRQYKGWPGEHWLDIRRLDLLAPILRSRLDECQQKGFDGVEADNVDGFLNDTGFEITYDDQLAFNRWLAEEAHARGLSIGLKNDVEQALDLLPFFDWALTESCFEQDWCQEMDVFIQSGKAVIDVEYSNYTDNLDEICPLAEAMQISVMWKSLDLDAFRQLCPPK